MLFSGGKTVKNVLGCLGILLLITLIAAIIGLAINDDETAKNEQKEQITEQGEKEEQVAKEKEEQELAKKEAEQKAAEEARLKEEAEQKAKEESVRQKQAEQTTDEKAQALGLEAVIISRVVDGDTVELSDKRKIRLVGVNTPESTTRHEVYGKEASDYTTSELEGKKYGFNRMYLIKIAIIDTYVSSGFLFH